MSRRSENERKRRQNMSNEQRENNLSRRRENYRRRKEQEKQAQTSRPINNHNCTSPNQRNNTSQSDTDDMDVDEALEDAVISCVNMDARENGALSRRPQESGHAFRAKHNIARNFKNNMMMAKSWLPHPFTCRHCNARLFHHESRDTCCNGGKVSFSRVDAPIELQQLFLDGSAEGKHFRQHIRSYNHVLSFTSIGVHVDENILASGRGIYTFRAQENIGKRTILPSSFIGGHRDMTQRYEDGMAIVLNGGKPDIFLTMTCNPSWSEITSELLPFQTPQDRPDLLTRIFRSKFEKLKDDVINKGVLGKVKSYMYVTEFQKRGLPHVHMLLVLESNDKLRDPKDYDSMIHLLNRHQVRFYDHQQIVDVLNNERNSKTMLTQFFALNLRDPQAIKYMYREIPEHYCWNKRDMEWHRRRSTRKVIGRIYMVSPSEGDKFYLRLLLSHVTGPTSWEYLLTNNGMTFSTFKTSTEDRGFLETDHSIRDCLVEATSL
ncbi:hypothetical protein KIW84_034457 [Lathyrus oleraceus]|uniref:Helitron helicase-like domain-containing protein n=1 Tax=Pisum sativum TaxID=3888 RepID=A0A9D5B172_PEA|nr:hypothetical protein KIW84_034457 [Pisum sativum]